MELPLPDSEISGVVSRYSFHHFPKHDLTALEISRILSEDGFLLISDPVPHPEDTEDFINQFMALKNDGHVAFHSSSNLEEIFKNASLVVDKQVRTSIRFPRELDAHYRALIGNHAGVIDCYRLEIKEDLVYVTVEVLNTRFIEE